MSNPLPRILLIDDEPENLRALERGLRNDFELKSFENGNDAMGYLAANLKSEISVVVSDYRMPDMNGVELLQKVGELDPLISKVMLTAYTEADQLLEAINRAQVFRYLQKPWNPDELLTTLKQAAERSQLKRQNAALVAELTQKNAELAKLNTNLESEVQRRTQELKALNEKLSQQALTDSLTKVPNRRAFFQRLSEEIDRSKRYRHSISVALFDVDHFKKFNDMEGHLYGDQALKTIAQTLSTQVRKTDMIARYGGEEFILMMPETGPDGGFEKCQRLRAAIEALTLQGKQQEAFLTVSIGLACFPEHGASPENLVEAADNALYQAKEQGRNRVVKFSPNESFFVR